MVLTRFQRCFLKLRGNEKNKWDFFVLVIMKSYNYIKHFIDAQVKELNRPIEINDELRDILREENINFKQFQIILMRINLLIKRHNNNMFSLRVINQIIHQIIKSENYKIDLTAERMAVVGKVIKPLMLLDTNHLNHNNPVHLEEFDVLARELPEAKYLFVGETGKGNGIQDTEVQKGQSTAEDQVDSQPDHARTTGPDHSTEDRDTPPSTEPEEDAGSSAQQGILVQDYEDMEETPEPEQQHFKQKLYHEIDKHTAIEGPLMEQYEATRASIIEVNNTLQYKQQKLEYLQLLRDELKMSLEGRGPLLQEIDRFKMLVETIRFLGETKEVMERLRT